MKDEIKRVKDEMREGFSNMDQKIDELGIQVSQINNSEVSIKDNSNNIQV